jgi:hypothetical protein
MNKIVIAYHAYVHGSNYDFMIGDQFVKLLSSKLFDNCHKLHIGIVDSPDKSAYPGIDWVRDWFKNTRHPEKVESVIYPSNNELTDTMKWVRDYAKENPGDYILFLHTKGISHFDAPTEDWRRYMEYFTIWNWQDCIAKLKEGYDCCGVMWNSKTVWGHYPHFSGAFWWASTDYINTLDHSYLDLEWKYYREFWIGSNPYGTAFEFHNSRMNDIEAFNESRSHYSLCYPAENYRKRNEKTLVEINKEEGYYLTDKGSIHNYLQFYDELFKPYRNEQINIFETGYQYGGSCELWRRYFPNAQIRSIDIKIWDKPSEDRVVFNLLNNYLPPSERVTMQLIDINEVKEDYFKDFRPNIAIEDGSHRLEDQLYFVKTIYPVLADKGILIIEDLQDWDNQIFEFNKLGLKFHVVDQREVSGIYDDVFIYFTKPEIFNSHEGADFFTRE